MPAHLPVEWSSHWQVRLTPSIFFITPAPLLRVLAHPGNGEVDPKHVMILLRYKLFAARADVDLHTMVESRFSSKLIFELKAYSLPCCLSESPFLPLPG